MLRIFEIFADNKVNALIVCLFFIFAVLTALIFHELAHAWTAFKCGDPSAKFAGRLSLNPAKHLDPLGTLLFLFIGLGWAKPVPINPVNFKNPRRDTFLVSISGILTNLIIAFIASFFYVLLYVNNAGIWIYLFQYIMLLNIVFATFNLLPIAPLDGFGLILSLAPQSAYVKFMMQNRFVALIILLVILQFTPILGWMQSGITGIFLDFWGLFL